MNSLKTSFKKAKVEERDADGEEDVKSKLDLEPDAKMAASKTLGTRSIPK